MTAIGPSSFGDKGNSSIRSAINRSSGSQSEDPTKPEKIEGSESSKDKSKSDSTETKTGKKEATQGSINQDTTVGPASADDQATARATEQSSAGRSTNILNDLDSINPNSQAEASKEAWEQNGASDEPPPTLLESIPGYPALDRPDRHQILANFDQLQQEFNIQEPSNLIGNPADPKEAARQMAQLGGQALLGPGSGALSHLGGAQGGGVGNNYGLQQQFNQTNIGQIGPNVDSVSSPVRQVVETDVDQSDPLGTAGRVPLERETDEQSTPIEGL